ncbi:MAG: VOC family protein [Gammaproteobacteria bacterium]|jgi:catechol 2,3-dioxygenase-like lactoylglutathione lyase family enzyme
MDRPPATIGMRHVALFVPDLEACEHFYVGLLGMEVEWRPDPDNVYLTSGQDNLALHRLPAGVVTDGPQRLDHIGFMLAQPGDVEAWHGFLLANGVKMKTSPRTHRDGARSFYCLDPCGTVVQMIFHPPLAGRGDSG